MINYAMKVIVKNLMWFGIVEINIENKQHANLISIPKWKEEKAEVRYR